jgi:hypothetical protein
MSAVEDPHMQPHLNRRDLMAAGAVLGLGDLSFITRLPPVQDRPNVVRLRSDMEPLVRLLEETPRAKLLEEVAARIRAGAAYPQILGALLLAGVRNIQPRPHVGYKFHAVMVVHSAHQASIASPVAERWLPIFWALDHFKGAQAQDVKEGDWTMAPVDEAKVPTGSRVFDAFTEAMDAWDEPAADLAAAGLARTATAQEAFELLCRYGARDFRDIGHKAIFVANGWRTLGTIGWQHAEPVLRSMAYALLKREGTNPAKADLPPDRPGRRNARLIGKIRDDWQAGKLRPEATAKLLEALRTASDEEACQTAVDLLNAGASPRSIWDAVMTGAMELLLRKPNIASLHAVTSTNALRFAYETSVKDDTRRFLLLQNVAFNVLFRQMLDLKGDEPRIDGIEPAAPSASGADAVEEIFAEVSRDRMQAARKILGYMKDAPSATPLIDAARLLVFFKGDDAHDYKYGSAVLEDYHQIAPEWRDRYLAAAVFMLQGAGQPDNPLVARTRAALGG